MATYRTITKKRTSTPQSQPIPGRENEMKQNLAGGYGFKANDWIALRRWLLTGSMFNAFYQGKEDMTNDSITLLTRCVKEDPVKTADEIMYASNKGVNNHTPILALLILSMGEDKAKSAYKQIFNDIVRTGSHLYEFLSYVRDYRGFGNVIHKSVDNWLSSKDIGALEYQFLKYQNREGWTGRDVLRVFKPVPQTDDHKALYKWMTGAEDVQLTDALKKIAIYEQLKKGNMSGEDVASAIKTFGLTWEMIPGNIEMSKVVWDALFQKMPINATIRNLGNLTDKGVFEVKNLDVLEERFTKENLMKARVHPVVLASALMVYEKGGRLGKSKLTWDPIPRVLDILNQSVDLSFDTIEPTGKQFYHALDVSSSMTGGAVGTMWLTPLQVEGIMALASIKSEKNYFVGGFSTTFSVLSKFTKTVNYSAVTNYRSGVWPREFGGTDAAVAYDYAIAKKVFTDVFVFWTDSESWAGRRHPAQALAQYRKEINKDAKAIYITLVPYSDQITLSDPKDPLSYDVAGFTSETPKLISMIAKGDM